MYPQVPSLSCIDTWKNNTLSNRISDLFFFLIFTHSKSPLPPPIVLSPRHCVHVRWCSRSTCGCVCIFVCVCALTKKRTCTWREKVSFVFSRFKLISTNWTNAMRKNAAPELEAPDARLSHHNNCVTRLIIFLWRKRHLNERKTLKDARTGNNNNNSHGQNSRVLQ